MAMQALGVDVMVVAVLLARVVLEVEMPSEVLVESPA